MKLNLKKLHKIQQVNSSILYRKFYFNQYLCIIGRVYVLKWKNSTKKIFFWMQEPKEDNDEEYCKKINDLVGVDFY